MFYVDIKVVSCLFWDMLLENVIQNPHLKQNKCISVFLAK